MPFNKGLLELLQSLIFVGAIIKLSIDILKNMFSTEKTLQEYVSEKEKTKVYYRAAGGRYFNVVTPYPTGSTQEIGCPIVEKYYKIIGAILSTSLFWFYQQSYTDGLHIKQSELLSYPVPNLDKLTDTEIQIINKEYDSYLEDIEKNTIVHQTTGYNVDSFKEYKLGKSKHYIDKLDDVVGKLYGLTKEQVDYIKNYEINVRTRD